jgi:hypothetical protein
VKLVILVLHRLLFKPTTSDEWWFVAQILVGFKPEYVKFRVQIQKIQGISEFL